MIEAGRTVLMRRIGQVRGAVREPIPPVRWLLAPWRTLLLSRRMALWQITSYGGRTAHQSMFWISASARYYEAVDYFGDLAALWAVGERHERTASGSCRVSGPSRSGRSVDPA